MTTDERSYRLRRTRDESLLALGDLERIIRETDTGERRHILPDVERLLEVIQRARIAPALRDEQAMVIRSYAVLLGLGGAQASTTGLARLRVRRAIEQLRDALAG